MKNREGRGAVCQRHAHIHVPVWVNNSWRGCAELKVCHCVWGAAVEGDVAFIFDGEVDGVGFIKSRRGRRGALGGWWRRRWSAHYINPSGKAFFHPFGHWGGVKWWCLSEWKQLQLQQSGNRWRGRLLICFTQTGTYMWEHISLARTHLIYYNSLPF